MEEILSILPLYDGILLNGGGDLLPHVEQLDVLPALREQNPDRYDFEAEIIKYNGLRESTAISESGWLYSANIGNDII